MRYISSLVALALFLMLASSALAGTGTITIYGTNATNADTNATAAGTDNNIQVTAWGVGDVAHTFRINVVNASDTLTFIIGNFTPGRIIEIKVNGTAYNGFQATDDGEIRFTRTQVTSNQTYTLTTALTESGRNATWGFFYDLHMLNGTVENVNVVSTKYPLPNASIPASALNITSMTGLGSIYASTDQLNISSTTYTKVVLDTVLYGSACATNGNCTAPVSGTYTISGNAHFYNTVADKRVINNIYVNEALLQEYYAETSIGGAGDAVSLMFTKTIHLNAGDRVAMYVWQNDGTGTTDLIGAMTYLEMTLVRMDLI